MAGGLVGYAQWAYLMVTSLPIWLGGLVGLLFSFLKGPHTFFYRIDRSNMKFSDPPGLEHGFHEVNGIRLHVVVGGRSPTPGSKKLMLFVHGFPEAWFSWRHQLKAFEDDYEVAALDLRGYGDSDKPPGRASYRTHEMVQDILELIGSLGHQKCILVAHDWGANIAWNFAACHQDKLHSLICMAAPPGKLWKENQDRDQKRRSAYVWLFQLPLLPELLIAAHDYKGIEDAFVGKNMGCKTPGAITAEEVERYKASMAKPGALTAGLNYYRAMVDQTTWNPPPRRSKRSEVIRVPTLFIMGREDGALGTQLLKGLDKMVQDPEVHILENCSHWVQQDQPEVVNDLIRKFLAKQS